MSDNQQRLRKAISQASERGFEWFRLKSSRGDSNCPYPVTYHPQDGHGYEDITSLFETDEIGQRGFFDEEIKSEDVIITLARAFESFPNIKPRDRVGNK